jgi:Asp-tRNA(Asn)/Glu-tRNA(Gln) amidotransferase A subunit family amidase
MTEPWRLSASEVVREIAAGRLSAETLVSSCLDRVRAVESKLKAWVVIDEAHALEQARAVDGRLARGEPPRKLSGVPIGVKDVFNTEHFPTEWGSPLRQGFKAGNDARAVAALRLEGAVIPGKTVTAEFAVHWPGPTRNPHDLDHTPGTSSSGSAAAVAAGMVPAAIGTQTAGSTIRPASFCGVYGMKPSFGLIPRTGMLKTTDTLDHVGIFARTADDLALLLDVLRVHGPDYPIVAAALVECVPAGRPWRVGLVRGPRWERTQAYAREALEAFAWRLAGAGIEVEPLELPPEFEAAYAVHADLYDSCLAYYFREECGTRPDLVSPRFLELVERGRRVTPARYEAALAAQTALARSFEDLCGRVDVVATLASDGEAPKGDEPAEHQDTCLLWTLCGVPAVTAPAFTGPRRLPFGLQLVARKYGDLTLLRFVRNLEYLGLVPPASMAEVP